MILLAVLLTPVLAACQPETVEVTRIVKETVVETVIEEKEVEVEVAVEVEVTREVEVEVIEETEVEVTRIVEVEAEPAEVTEFVFAHTGPIRTMDAPVTWYGSTHWLTNLLYDCLIWRNADGSGYHGQAAESWESINPTTWRFHLREGNTFQNGEPLDANAVKWNIDRVRTREDFLVMGQWAFVDEVIVVDEWTVDITTPKVHAYFEYDVSYNGCELLPPGYIEEMGEEYFAQHPVGSGPYMLTKFIASERYEFTAWDGYWDGRPEVDRVVYQVIPEPASQVAALLSGQVDMIANIPVPDREHVASAPGIRSMTASSNRMHHLYLRTETEAGGLAEKYPDHQPVTLDKNIRHAISHALDRTLLGEIQGSGYPTLVRVPRAYPEGFADVYAGPEVADAWYDPELAMELIKEAGFDPDAGNKPTVVLDSPNYYFGNEKEVAEVIAIMLEEVGFEVELNVLDKSAYFEQIDEPGYNRDLLLVTLGGGPSLVPLFYTCDWWETTYHVCDEEWDEVANSIMTTVDAAERLTYWESWWEYFLDYSQTVTLYEIQNMYAISENFDWTPRADGWMTFRGLSLAD
jgi:peptide/nickel transport system substrate-binding protein